MSVRETLDRDLKQAMRDRDPVRLACIRMLRAKLQDREVALRAKHGKDHVLTDDEALEVVATYAKQRRESIDSYRQAGRDDLVAAEEAELRAVEVYLPAQLDEVAVREIVAAAVRGLGEVGPRDMGRVMQAVMPDLKGRADGKLVNRVVREVLGAG